MSRSTFASFREDARDVGAALDLPVHPLERVPIGYDTRDARLPEPTPHWEGKSASDQRSPRSFPNMASERIRRVTITRRPIPTALARRGCARRSRGWIPGHWLIDCKRGTEARDGTSSRLTRLGCRWPPAVTCKARAGGQTVSRGGSPALPPPLLPAVPSSICRRQIFREATSVTEFAQGTRFNGCGSRAATVGW